MSRFLGLGRRLRLSVYMMGHVQLGRISDVYNAFGTYIGNERTKTVITAMKTSTLSLDFSVS